MPQSEPQSSNLEESYDNIPSIDDDEEGECKITSKSNFQGENQFFHVNLFSCRER